jgi:hypothetical protein
VFPIGVENRFSADVYSETMAEKKTMRSITAWGHELPELPLVLDAFDHQGKLSVLLEAASGTLINC